ncbi:MAG: OmpH family outer membrane protein [Bacteroidales bacterium]|jgi:outer membrane protein|nr:OmpH family outer membrane protein [Bacteroidales bacterium]MBR0321194.1 OmpH family outer membrane protein [Bacteroidales bacterium]MBR5811160.1 OmpH family outer membrane protein [Bacteroidales bacterium]
MKKIILIAVMAVMSVAASAQNLKFGYVNFNEIVMLMPEMDAARATMEENQKTNEEILMSMYQEYQTKMQDYQAKAATWTSAIRESKEKELMDIESRLQQTQQSLQQEMQQLQSSLQAPIYEKAQTTVQEIAKAQGLAFVFEESSLLYIDPAQGVNLTTEARKALNIPEGRTLEALQAELEAKAMAAQQGQM